MWALSGPHTLAWPASAGTRISFVFVRVVSWIAEVLKMIETRVRVTAAADGVAWVAANQQSACGACQAKSVCGVSGLGQFLNQGRPDLPLAGCHAQPGDELVLSIDETTLLGAGLYAYLLPAVLGIAAASGADAAGRGDGFAALAALGGIALGLLLSRWFAPRPRVLAAPIPTSLPGASHD
jgi:sigma-E factor negative regulatory protein RseC